MAEQKLVKVAEGREAEIYAWEDGRVLRLMRSADAKQAVERQAHALRAARAAGVSVPEVHGATEALGRPGLIMERIEGTDLLTLLGSRPWLVWSIGAISGRMHAQLHDVAAPDDLRALRPALRESIASSRLVPAHLAELAVGVLDALPDGDRLCHGDFHPGNIMRTTDGYVLIDWTNAIRGDPTADYARTDLMIRIGEPPPGSPFIVRTLAAFGRGILQAAYRRAYRRHRPIDPALVTHWEVPVAANRLTDNIESERPALLKLLEERMNAAEGRPSGRPRRRRLPSTSQGERGQG